MADFADLGADREEKDRALALNVRALALKVRAPEGPSATGMCLCCGEPLADGLRWCDAECRDVWQAEQRRGV